MAASTKAGMTIVIPTIADLLQLDAFDFAERNYDVATLNLVCATGLPGTEDVNVSRSLLDLDAMAIVVRQRTQRAWHVYERHPEEFYQSRNIFRVIFMLDTLHRQFGVRYNPARIDRSDESFDPLDSADLFIHGILSNMRTGTCASLPVFAVAIGRRLGYPLKLVRSPEHLFFRWETPTVRFNVEYNGFGGNIYSDDHYMSWPAPWTPKMQQAQQHARWLTTMGTLEEIECFLGHRFLVLDALGRWEEALNVLLAAERFNPRSKPLHFGLRERLLEKLASRDGVPRQSTLLGATLLVRPGRNPGRLAIQQRKLSMPSNMKSLGMDPFKRRFMDPTTGRFPSLDAYAGDSTDPLSYNKYLYTQGDPINGTDPTGDNAIFWLLSQFTDAAFGTYLPAFAEPITEKQIVDKMIALAKTPKNATFLTDPVKPGTDLKVIGVNAIFGNGPPVPVGCQLMTAAVFDKAIMDLVPTARFTALASLAKFTNGPDDAALDANGAPANLRPGAMISVQNFRLTKVMKSAFAVQNLIYVGNGKYWGWPGGTKDPSGSVWTYDQWLDYLVKEAKSKYPNISGKYFSRQNLLQLQKDTHTNKFPGNRIGFDGVVLYPDVEAIQKYATGQTR